MFPQCFIHFSGWVQEAQAVLWEDRLGSNRGPLCPELKSTYRKAATPRYPEHFPSLRWLAVIGPWLLPFKVGAGLLNKVMAKWCRLCQCSSQRLLFTFVHLLSHSRFSRGKMATCWIQKLMTFWGREKEREVFFPRRVQLLHLDFFPWNDYSRILWSCVMPGRWQSRRGPNIGNVIGWAWHSPKHQGFVRLDHVGPLSEQASADDHPRRDETGHPSANGGLWRVGPSDFRSWKHLEASGSKMRFGGYRNGEPIGDHDLALSYVPAAKPFSCFF